MVLNLLTFQQCMEVVSDYLSGRLKSFVVCNVDSPVFKQIFGKVSSELDMSRIQNAFRVTSPDSAVNSPRPSKLEFSLSNT